MNKTDIYSQMAERTQGNIYMGIVGPVRTGKSTFIKRFMELMVLPTMETGWIKERFSDEMPQSAAGRTIMTTQVQFVPDEAVEITLPPNTKAKLRLIDCVGYMVDGALGHMEEGEPRMVKTAWFDHEVPFEVAAETGTKKVIRDYSTIGIVITTDGSIAGIDRQAYVEAEKKVIEEMTELGKPFIVLVNSRNPQSAACQKTASYIRDEYDVAVKSIDVLNMNEEDIAEILGAALYEFPARIMSFQLPDWIKNLPYQHWLWEALINLVKLGAEHFARIRDYEKVVTAFKDNEDVADVKLDNINPGEGEIQVTVMLDRALFYNVLSQQCSLEIESDRKLLEIMNSLVAAKKEYDYFRDALEEAKITGYGIVSPRIEEMELEEPEIIRQGRGYGVALKAKAPSWHIMKADIGAEIAPMVGSEQQGEELVSYLLNGFESDRSGIWNTEIFGKSLNSLMREGLNQKLNNMPVNARAKIRDTVERMINETGGGLVCILF